MLKILSWNIQQGGGSRIHSIERYIQDSKAQIIVLSEFRTNNKGIHLRHFLLTAGYRHQLVSQASMQVNSVLIASNLPFDSTMFSTIDPQYSNNLLLATFSSFQLFGGYFPHKKEHTLFEYLLQQDLATPTIITGDLNTGINGVDQKGNSFWYEKELQALHEQGMKDAFRSIHGDVREYSWYSHQKNGYRYDHFLVQEDILPVIQDCYYDHIARENKLSDHSPMYLTLGTR